MAYRTQMNKTYCTTGPKFPMVLDATYTTNNRVRDKLQGKQEDELHITGSVLYGLSTSGGKAVMPWNDHSALSVFEHLTFIGSLSTSSL